MKKLLTVLSIALLSTTVYAAESNIAAGEEMDAAPTESTDLNAKWKMLDVDSNGFIGKEEAASDSDVSTNWDAIDSNQDGQIALQEFVDFFQ